MIALVILSVALLGIAILSFSVVRQSGGSSVRTDQVIAAQEVIERVRAEGFSAATTGSSEEQVSVGGRTYTVTRTVTDVAPRLKEVQAVVMGGGIVAPDTLVTRIHQPKTFP